MKIPVCILQIFKKKTGSTTAYDFDNPYSTEYFSSVNANYGYKDKKDTFSINLVPYKKYNVLTASYEYKIPDIENEDVIKIYVYYEDETGILSTDDLDDYLLFCGTIQNYAYASNSGILSLKVSGANRTEVLLNNLTFASYKETIVPDMIVDMTRKIRGNNPSKIMFVLKDYKGDGTDSPGDIGAYDKDNTNWYNSYLAGKTAWGLTPLGKIRAYKKEAYEYDSTNHYWKLKSTIDLNELKATGEYRYRFNNHIYYETYKTLYTHLEVLSRTVVTGDYVGGQYITYVDNNNVVYWEPKKTTQDTQSETGTSALVTIKEADTNSLSVNKQVKDVINAIIINAGQDVRHNGILALSINPQSMSKYGAKWKYKANSVHSDELRKAQQQYVIDNGGEYNSQTNFPTSGSYPVTAGIAKASSILDDGTPIWEYAVGTSIANDSEYNTYIRRLARENAKEEGLDIVANNEAPRYFGDFVLDVGTNTFFVGQYINVQIPSFPKLGGDDLIDVELRIENITHTIDSQGWKTKLELSEESEAL